MLITLTEDIALASKAKEWDTLKEIKKRDYTINSYVSYAMRNLTKYGYTSISKTGLIYTLLKFLELYSDEVCELAKNAAETKKPFTPSLPAITLLQRQYLKYDATKIFESTNDHVGRILLNVDELLRQLKN
jgi:hypothetical protein